MGTMAVALFIFVVVIWGVNAIMNFIGENIGLDKMVLKWFKLKK